MARIIDLPETKGRFQLKGIVSGTEKDGFYKELKTRSNKDMRLVKFGATYNNGNTLYLNLQGMEMENVYFSKKADKIGEKPDVQKVSWSDRFSYNREGYKLIGNNIGVKKKIDSDGKTVNDKKMLTDFDACKEIAEFLNDDVSIFTRGTIDYSSYYDDQHNKRLSIKLVPNQVSLCADIDFNDENYKQQNDFNQIIIFMGIDKESDDSSKDTGRFIVSAKIVTYSNIEDVEFIIEDLKLANLFRKNLKPYNSIKVSGHIVTSIQTETVDDDDDWGESDAMERITAPTKREFIITGAKGSTIDRDTYTEQNVEEAIAKITKANKADSDFGDDSSDWGSLDDVDDDEDVW